MTTVVQEFLASACAPLTSASTFPFDAGSFAGIVCQLMIGSTEQPLLLQPGLWALVAFALRHQIRATLAQRGRQARLEGFRSLRWQSPEPFEGPRIPRRPTLPPDHRHRIARPRMDRPVGA